jgi:hypothetical protein
MYKKTSKPKSAYGGSISFLKIRIYVTLGTNKYFRDKETLTRVLSYYLTFIITYIYVKSLFTRVLFGDILNNLLGSKLSYDILFFYTHH